MRRLYLAPLVLLAVPPACLAADTDADPASRKGACVYVRPAGPGAGPAGIAADADAPQARPPVPPVSRSTARGIAPAAGGGGGGVDNDGMPVRNRGSRWHSFLPGMFR